MVRVLVSSQRPCRWSSNRRVKDSRRVVFRDSKGHEATEARTSKWEALTFSSIGERSIFTRKGRVQFPQSPPIQANAKTRLGSYRKWLKAGAFWQSGGSKGRKPVEPWQHAARFG